MIYLVTSEWYEPAVFSPRASLTTGTNDVILKAYSFGNNLFTELHVGSG